jgi:NAD(P)-dependent dehydrogenase (short-subunit alcohol dehydrogenase family)
MLQGKVAVVTGSAIGIGRGICVSLAEQGARVVALDIDIHNNAETARQVRATGQECLAIDCDVSDKTQVRNAFNLALQAYGRIDLLVNNAAVWDNSALLEGTYESQTAEFDRAMGSCTMGTYYCTLAATPALIAAGGGNVINVITEHVKEGHLLTNRPALGYDAAKFGQWRLTAVMAEHLAPENIRVNGLCFGATDTPMLRGVAPEMADAAMKVEDLGQAILNIVSHGPGGPSGETYLFGTSGSPRDESLVAIAALAP